MGSRYLTWLADELRAAGLEVVEYDGWQTRARGSGGYEPGRPWLVMWHHTASKASAEDDAAYEAEGADAAPICNVNIDRDGVVWLLAAGATNTNGSGDPVTVSKGTVPADQMNTYAFGMEIANDGVGELYPAAQIDAAFTVSDVVNRMCGNEPGDVCTHAVYSPGRKIDPAKATSVQGGWRPAGYSSADTWALADLVDECNRRAAPPDPGDDDMTDEQLAAITSRLDAIADAQQADFDRDGTFGPKADQGISQRSAIYDALGSIGTKLDTLIAMLGGPPGR